MNILLTGGLGFIGSHIAVELLNKNYNVIIYDNLSNSQLDVSARIEKITNKKPVIIIGDINNNQLLSRTFEAYSIDLVIHLAAFKAVGESVTKPLDYYDNNVTGTLTLLRAMISSGVTRIIFSSSATVYGEPKALPLDEDAPLAEATNPYGRTKRQVEDILSDVCRAYPQFSAINLRYFNPIGAHESGLIGEDPSGIPNNLVPYVARVAMGSLEKVQVFGNDYPTKDGTGIRDYIHVVDLAIGHVKAIDYAMAHTGWIAFNLGCGRGYSVLEVIHAFEEASGRSIPYHITNRRDGDIAEIWCDPSKAQKLLNWVAKRDINQMCKDAWNFALKGGHD